MNSPEQNRLAWVALRLTPGLGPKRILRAAKALPDLSDLFRLSLTELESLNITAPPAQFIFNGHARTEAERELVRVVEQKGQIHTIEDED
jgi:DNA processing protein